MRSERGQAMAEYHVLYPGAILLSFAALWMIGGTAKDLFRRAISEILDVTTEPVSLCVQEIVEQHGGSGCEDSEYCTHIEPGDNPACGDFQSCSKAFDWPPGVVVLKASTDYYIQIEEAYGTYASETDDGCYAVTYNMWDTLYWQKISDEPGCPDISHVQAWHIDAASCE